MDKKYIFIDLDGTLIDHSTNSVPESAKKAIKDGNIEKKFYWTNRSIAVITELISVLDMEQKGSISKYLVGLYNYEIQLLSKAAAYDEVEKVDEVSNVFKGLLEAWKESTDVAN